MQNTSVKQIVEMVVTEVHEYTLQPKMSMGMPQGPGTTHGILAASSDEPALICIHMEKLDKSPVEPNIPPEARAVVQGLRGAGFMSGTMHHVVAQANIVISPEEYDKMGRPRPREKIRVTFEYEGQ